MTGSTSSEQGATPASIEAEVAGYVVGREECGLRFESG